MRILILAPHAIYPPRHGTGVRVYHLARELGKRHAVTVVCFDDRAERLSGGAPPFEIVILPWSEARPGRIERWCSQFGMLVRTAASPGNLAVLRRLIESRRIEAVIVENLGLSHLVGELRGRPLLWVEEGISSELRHPSLKGRRNPYRRIQDWIEYFSWRRLEAWVWRKADALAAVSEAEAALLLKRVAGSKPVTVIPNGVDARHFALTPPAPLPGRILFVGSRWYPNVEALNLLVSEILPRIRRQMPDARLQVAGEVCGSRELRFGAGEDVILLGFVDDLRGVYAESHVFVAPLLRGHGTRIKILEAMAAGVPVVSTSKGAEGLEVQNGAHLLLADTPEEFADGVVRVMRDPVLASRLRDAARALVADRYDWRRIAETLEDTLLRFPRLTADEPTRNGAVRGSTPAGSAT